MTSIRPNRRRIALELQTGGRPACALRRAGLPPIHNSRDADTDSLGRRVNRNSDVAYYAHDGNKNVADVIASNGDIVAHYDYAPFGAVIAQSGALASANPFGFSSEYQDRDLGLVYYNYRHYDPVTGRWMSRDPIEEEGGLGLYGFVGNRVSCLSDFVGASDCPCGRDLTYVAGPDRNKPNDEALDWARENLGSPEKRKLLGFIPYTAKVNHVTNNPSDFDPNSNLKDGECVCNLLVVMHGTKNSGGGRVGAKWGETWLHESPKESEISGMFNGIRFCEKCTIELRICYLGVSSDLKERLENSTKCTIKLNDTRVSPNGTPIPDSV